MLKEWEDFFEINSEVRFGPIIDNDGINLFYDEGDDTKRVINNLTSMITSLSDFRSVMLAGYAGVGKTTLLHYIKKYKLDLKKYDFFIINGEENTDNKGIIHDLNSNFKVFYDQLYSQVNINNRTSGETEIKNILDGLFADLVYISDPVEKTRLYLGTYTKLSETSEVVKTGYIKHLRIALDQIDLLDNIKMLEILENSFAMIIHSKYITAMVSARPETLDSAKKSMTNFFATNFGRSLEMKSVPAECILKKRLETSSGKKMITMSCINAVFPKPFCELMNKIHNTNIRKTLSVYEHIMQVMPVLREIEATNAYTNFLLENSYIDDLYQRVNPIDNVPLIKIVFDALQFKTIADKKFFRVIITQIMINKKNSRGVSEENIRKVLEYLKNLSFISESFDIKDKYVITPKGEAYRALVKTETYKRLYCKAKDDQAFCENIFDDVNFP